MALVRRMTKRARLIYDVYASQVVHTVSVSAANCFAGGQHPVWRDSLRTQSRYTEAHKNVAVYCHFYPLQNLDQLGY